MMKILIYGAGVIGCTYGWQLAKTGYNISVLVRKGKKEYIEKNGINIYCTDFRNNEKVTETVLFHPTVTENLTADNDFEYIIVTTKSLHLEEILPILKESSGKAHILFFQNVWQDDLKKISKYLTPEQYFFGFPFMAGGGRDKKGINAIISCSQYSKTMLGEISGKVTPRIQKITNVMSEAGMNPFISSQIVTWLIPHYAFIACISAGIIKSGGTMNAFISKPAIIKETTLSIREGFHICSKLGVNPKKEKVNRLYYLPLIISTLIIRKVFNDEAMQTMFDEYLKNSIEEIKMMTEKIIADGKKYNTEIKYLTLQQKLLCSDK